MLQRGRVSMGIGGSSALTSAVEDFGIGIEETGNIQPFT
jgi:hypothetical protein